MSQDKDHIAKHTQKVEFTETYSDVKPTNVENDEISLKELILKLQEWWKYLLSKWVIILLAGMIGGVSGFTYAYFKKPVYIAETTFVLEDGGDSGSMGSYAGLASLAGINLNNNGGGIFQSVNIIQLYKSNRMIEQTLTSIDTFNNNRKLLIDKYLELNQIKNKLPGESFTKIFNSKDSYNNKRLIDSILSAVSNDIRKNYLEVEKSDDQSGIIIVRTNSIDEAFSKSFTDNIVKNVNQFYIDTKTKKASEDLTLLQNQADSLKNLLKGSIAGVANSIDQNPNSNPAFQSLKVPSQLKQIDVQASGTAYQEIMKNLELAKITLRKDRPLIQVIDESKLPLSKVRSGKVKFLILGTIISMILISIILILKRLIFNALNNGN